MYAIRSYYETLFEQQHKVLQSFEDFTNEKMPDIDAVIHRHIDILRIAEQDHYKHLQKALTTLMESDKSLHESIGLLKNSGPAPVISEAKLKEVVLKVDNLLQQVVNDFERQMISLRAQSEGISTAMAESDSLIGSIRDQEETMMSYNFV